MTLVVPDQCFGIFSLMSFLSLWVVGCNPPLRHRTHILMHPFDLDPVSQGQILSKRGELGV